MTSVTILARFGVVAALALPMAACVEQPPPPPPAPAYRPPPPPVAYVPPPPPVGITVFTGIGYRGAATPIDHAVPDLAGSGIDHRISSVQVTGGRWELCSHRGFRGRCVFVASSVKNLAKLGMNNKIASIRRAP